MALRKAFMLRSVSWTIERTYREVSSLRHHAQMAKMARKEDDVVA